MFDWDEIPVMPSEILTLMRAHRSDAIEILFRYGDRLYRVGVSQENPGEPFFMDGETYPSMFVFNSTASLEDGLLLLDLQIPLGVLAVNRENPAAWFDAERKTI